MEKPFSKAHRKSGLLPVCWCGTLFASFINVIVTLLLMMACLCLPNVLPFLEAFLADQPRFQNAPPVFFLLQSYQVWYFSLTLVLGGSILAAVVIGMFLLRRLYLLHRKCVRAGGEVDRLYQAGIENEESIACSNTQFEQYLNAGLSSILLVVSVVPLLILFSFLFGVMLKSEKIPSLLLQTVEDLRQLEAGHPEQVTVWLSPKARSSRLPGPYSKGQPEPATRYGGISSETEGEWVWFYIPKDLDFTLDPDRLYDETQTIAWNEANAQQYLLTYTTNFHLVVTVEPASGSG